MTMDGAFGFKILPDRSVELGNLVRGERCGHYQLTYYAELALIDWIFQALPVDVIFGISMADNLMCSTLQRSLGFRRAQRIPLLKAEHGGELHFRFGEPGAESPDGLYAQKFELDRAEFFRRKSHWPCSSAGVRDAVKPCSRTRLIRQGCGNRSSPSNGLVM